MCNKSYLILLGTLLLSSSIFAQSFQWGKRGGATDALQNTGNYGQEEVYKIVTDSQKNIYILSTVGKNGLNIDGNPKTNFGDNTQLTDVVLASFSCSGTYRWSKIIGGMGYDQVNDLHIDQSDNIYIAGQFANCGNTTYPPRIDSDVIISQSPTDCSLGFLAKYNNNGVMQWIRRPQPAVTSQSAYSIGMALDAAGNSYWLMWLPAGTYANGAFVNTMPGNNLFLLKYDTGGNFISATYMDMQLSNGGFLSRQKIYRNPYNGLLYITSLKNSSSETAIIGGQTVTGGTFLACFNDTGTFQWMRENTGTTVASLQPYNIVFDNDNSIYISGRIFGFSSTTFIGLTVPENIATSFVMKTDATAQNKLWSTYYTVNGAEKGAIALNNNEIGFAGYCFSATFSWGGQTIPVNGDNQGTEALLARFDKTNGNCLGLTRIVGETGYDDGGTALAVDASGDYIYGGYAGRTLTFATNTMIATGVQSDFFVAKYATSPCTLNTGEFIDEGLQLYPNPADGVVQINTKEKLEYSIYTITGSLIQKGIITESNNSIDVSALAAGCYIVTTTDDSGGVKTVKLLKK